MPDPERIAIVGLGLIGGSLALALRRARPALRIVGVDVDPRAREQALEARAVDAATTFEEAPFQDCATVLPAIPPHPLLDAIPAAGRRLRPGLLRTALWP